METTDKSAFIKENGVYVSTPQGKSMLPFIRGGRDVVTVLPLSGDARKYDVILYEKPNGTNVMHRVLRVRENDYFVRGDNCYYNESIPKESVLGVISEVLKDGKKKQNNGARHMLAVRMWRYCYPVRYLLHGLKALLYRVYRGVFKK